MRVSPRFSVEALKRLSVFGVSYSVSYSGARAVALAKRVILGFPISLSSTFGSASLFGLSLQEQPLQFGRRFSTPDQLRRFDLLMTDRFR